MRADLNPLAQRLARTFVLASDDGHNAWSALAARSKAGQPLPEMHVWYADVGPRGTVCAIEGQGSIEEMKEVLPAANVRFFPKAGHSIHNSDRAAFMGALRDVIDGAARRSLEERTSTASVVQPRSRL